MVLTYRSTMWINSSLLHNCVSPMGLSNLILTINLQVYMDIVRMCARQHLVPPR